MSRAGGWIGRLRLWQCARLGSSGWTAPGEVSRLQWHMLECALPGEHAIRTRWHVAVWSALSKRIKRRGMVDGMMACWGMTDGRIDTATGDQSRGWCAPPMAEEADSSSWSPDSTAPAPSFRLQTDLAPDRW